MTRHACGIVNAVWFVTLGRDGVIVRILLARRLWIDVDREA